MNNRILVLICTLFLSAVCLAGDKYIELDKITGSSDNLAWLLYNESKGTYVIGINEEIDVVELFVRSSDLDKLDKAFQLAVLMKKEGKKGVSVEEIVDEEKDTSMTLYIDSAGELCLTASEADGLVAEANICIEADKIPRWTEFFKKRR